MVVRKSMGEKIFDCTNYIFMLLLILVTIYPILYVAFASISDPARLMSNSSILWKPLGFTLEGYRLVLNNPNIIIGYENTLFYVIAGIALNLFMTVTGAYVLSRKKLMFRNLFMIMIVITMFFHGGLVPRYFVIRGLGLINNRLALIIPTAIATYNLIIMRTSMLSIPDSLEESAQIDGANDFTILFRIIIPLSIPVLAVMALFYGVSHWNAWFDAMLFIRNRDLYPLQLFLREILIESQTKDMMTEFATYDQHYNELVKYCTIMVATLPILFAYPFLQKYFVKGVMIGAIKG